MTERERQIIELLRENPMLPQAEIAQRLGITRSSVGVHLANLSKKGYILGKGYVLAEAGERYVVGNSIAESQNISIVTLHCSVGIYYNRVHSTY